MKLSIKELYKKAVLDGTPERLQEDDNCRYVIYRGFKVIKSVGDSYSMFDVRHSDFYSEVEDLDLSILLHKGLVKGADYIMYSRDIKRIEDRKASIAAYYDKIEKVYKKNLEKGIKIKFYEKRIRNAYSNIKYNLDLLFVYKARKEMYERKYLN